MHYLKEIISYFLKKPDHNLAALVDIYESDIQLSRVCAKLIELGFETNPKNDFYQVEYFIPGQTQTAKSFAYRFSKRNFPFDFYVSLNQGGSTLEWFKTFEPEPKNLKKKIERGIIISWLTGASKYFQQTIYHRQSIKVESVSFLDVMKFFSMKEREEIMYNLDIFRKYIN